MIYVAGDMDFFSLFVLPLETTVIKLAIFYSGMPFVVDDDSLSFSLLRNSSFADTCDVIVQMEEVDVKPEKSPVDRLAPLEGHDYGNFF